jgi:methylenetetrahydrofolate--tRNA-(uracil-5-)-methyltransferase
MNPVYVVGAGFAGVECAWTLAEAGLDVRLIEMRPIMQTPAHTTGYFAELVCSNSFKSQSVTSPAGLLKLEMEALGSLVLKIAKQHQVPAGEALGVDRDRFGEAITQAIENHPKIDVLRAPFTPDDAELLLATGANQVVLCTGPLTSPDLADWLAYRTGRKHLYFYDAVSPTVDASSLDRSVVFAQSRYDKGEGDDYLNCPFEKDSYLGFVQALIAAERAPIHAFEAGGKRDLEPTEKDSEAEFLEKVKYFSGCTPIEAIAEKGERSLAFGNFKPVGLTDPRTGRRPYAALQLRPENREQTLYSLVACQTRLKWGEQKRVFRMVPGLEQAEFVRYGVIHRNTYLESPQVLTHELEMRVTPNLYIGGQLTGVEGYVESAAMGLYLGHVLRQKLGGKAIDRPPKASALGALIGHLMDDTPREFAPMNINWGLLPDPVSVPRDKGIKRAMKLEAAHAAFAEWIQNLGLGTGSGDDAVETS